ncbi:MAG TPA: twin-arginine translocase TatA/TatE family subunit [Flavisolibacter sp.]|jgi:sec-independent protein translocase protein TatA|nr:twin-arginine translocase TatA/TatE family subunit [Flavisolibacter sp.]
MDLFAPNHIILILLILLLFFGGKKIPELMRGLGRGVKEFTDAKNNTRKEVEEGLNDKNTRQQSATNAEVVTKPPVTTNS